MGKQTYTPKIEHETVDSPTLHTGFAYYSLYRCIFPSRPTLQH